MTHKPVLLNEVVDRLVTNPEGAYLDGTVGSGGYLKAISLKVADSARLFGIDLDPEAVTRSRQNLSDCPQVVEIVHGSYGNIESLVGRLKDSTFDGILLDLGLSSEQLDEAGRGFAFRNDGPLDMRFDSESGLRSAADLVNSLDEASLAQIIRDFGEERRAGRIAKAIVRERQEEMIRTTARMSSIVSAVVSQNHINKTLARVFQAFRIAVNRELDTLASVLPKMLFLLNPGGRLAVISYHSLEDRIVKQFMAAQERGCVCPPRLPICNCGQKPTLRRIPRRGITPSEEEQKSNPRSRSARLRVAERISS